MLDRSKIPAYTNDFDLRIKNLDRQKLTNGIDIYKIRGGSQEIIKIEVVFRRGRIHESQKAVAKASFKMLREGSQMADSKTIDHVFDFYGAVVRINTGMEYSSVSIFCLDKDLTKLWPYFFDMLINATYPEEELINYRTIQAQKTREILSKNDLLAYRLLTEKIFGSEHPYGYNTEPEDIEQLSRASLIQYFKENCGLNNAFVLLSGNFSSSSENLILSDLSSVDKPKSDIHVKFEKASEEKGLFSLPTENVHQTSIKMGCLWVPHQHESYFGLRFLNTILGGYFGSRLMKNIREDKGYTYGIYSMIDSFQKESYFYISADVGKDFIQLTIDEIYKEIETLKREPIDQSELEMVKNYLLGQSLHLIDGPFATAKLVKSLIAKNRDLEDYNRSIEIIKSIGSKEIQELAEQYFIKDNLTTVLVGNI